MKSFYSKSTIIAVSCCFIVFAALTVYAYTAPTVAAPGDNGEVLPLDTSANDQVKIGGLGVGTFYAGKVGGGSLFDQETTFDGVIRGGTPADQASSVSVGTDAAIHGTLKATDYLNSAKLRHGGADEAPICSDQSGVIILCP